MATYGSKQNGAITIVHLDQRTNCVQHFDMPDNKPQSESEYFDKHGSELGFLNPISAGLKIYEFNMKVARLALDPLLGELITSLTNAANTYANGRPELLYFPMKPNDLVVLTKPYSSVLTKIYRVNCLKNRTYPEEPKNGVVLCNGIYDHDQMNDLLRARLVCKYMDGPKFVAEKLREFCEIKGVPYRSYPMHNDRGYYAWHCYIRFPVEFMDGQEVRTRNVWFELQVTTQLAEVITALTHGLYETGRAQSLRSSDDAWRWEPRSQQFRSAYLGHSLHLLEGIIQTFRDEVLGIEPQSDAGYERAPQDEPMTMVQTHNIHHMTAATRWTDATKLTASLS